MFIDVATCQAYSNSYGAWIVFPGMRWKATALHRFRTAGEGGESGGKDVPLM